MLAYVGVFLVSAAAVAVVTPAVRRVAVRLGTIDRPSDRKVHPKPTPTGGGVGLLIGVAAGMVMAALVPSLRSAFRVGEELQGTLLAALVITAKVLAAVTAGAAFGFLPYNSYPARIFMGDSGSMLLGLLLASATISGVGRTVQPSGGDIAAFSIPVLIPAIVLAVPLLDVALAVIRRLRRGRPVFAPDKEHIHHQLLQIGHTHRRAVLIMYFWGVLAAGSALAITYINGRLLVSGILAAAFLLMAATVVPGRLKERAQARRARELAAQGGSSATPAAMPGRSS